MVLFDPRFDVAERGNVFLFLADITLIVFEYHAFADAARKRWHVNDAGAIGAYVATVGRLLGGLVIQAKRAKAVGMKFPFLGFF